ncbi:hypothetical protein LTSERUB_2055 [Salmonella enterica subsp. enterica serovar Rubislaw str. A4-653]|uniref:Uncharacterized protein n=1 Tax=Salmonella enterica subsp. enterica serovar Rubislaw str. A4-653 TaxID=913081 RepID=G5QHU2_SALRU|nr:hypothetical protein LTSERUB_2055 [Salmonella enterica subsp. enterica serovar Rubislaw str. A4-653]
MPDKDECIFLILNDTRHTLLLKSLPFRHGNCIQKGLPK